MEGIGTSHFPITTSNPEVQQWFDQGHTLLHSFWFYEAERAFHWCLKLEPENAMAYWGLARVAMDPERGAAFLREAVRRKAKVSDRERMYIEAWEAQMLPQPEDQGEDPPYDKKSARFRKRMERLCLKYPDDLAAKALLALDTLWTSSQVSSELLLRQVLSREPMHRSIPPAGAYR